MSAENHKLLAQEIEDRVTCRVIIRRGEIGELPESPQRLVMETAGLHYLVGSLEDQMREEDWSVENMRQMEATAVDLAATATRLAQALQMLQMRRRAQDQGSSLPWNAAQPVGDPFEGVAV
jgi:hypothetical protein